MRETYIAEGLVRSIYFHFPILGQESAIGAEYAECAGEQGAEHFWAYVDAVYEHQSEISEQMLEDLAAGLDVEADAMNECLGSHRHNTTWQIDRARGEAMGVQSTPTIFLAYVDKDGEEVRLQFRGARDFDNMSQIIDAILREIEQ